MAICWERVFFLAFNLCAVRLVVICWERAVILALRLCAVSLVVICWERAVLLALRFCAVSWWPSAGKDVSSWLSACVQLYLSRLTKKEACALSEDSDQPGHPSSLIRVFAVRMKKALVLSYPLNAQQMRMPKLICVFSGRTLFLLVLSYRGSYWVDVNVFVSVPDHHICIYNAINSLLYYGLCYDSRVFKYITVNQRAFPRNSTRLMLI